MWARGIETESPRLHERDARLRPWSREPTERHGQGQIAQKGSGVWGVGTQSPMGIRLVEGGKGESDLPSFFLLFFFFLFFFLSSSIWTQDWPPPPGPFQLRVAAGGEGGKAITDVSIPRGEGQIQCP